MKKVLPKTQAKSAKNGAKDRNEKKLPEQPTNNIIDLEEPEIKQIITDVP
jgi:hypothetical protein